MKRLVVLAFVILYAAVLSAADAAPKYVFLFIGDGMGKGHVALAARMLGPLKMERLPVRGSVSTVNVFGKTTDSAASGTAFACGVKTQNGSLGIDTDGKSVDSCAALAKRQGRRCAILTTVGLNNATPAAFYAHVSKRGEAQTILKQYFACPFDILAGTGVDGMKTGVKTEDFVSGAAYGTDGKEEKGSIENAGGKILVVEKNDAPFLALRDLGRPVLVHSSAADDLAKYVRKSIELMADSPNGFFMMAEGGRIDHAGHANDARRLVEEIRKFDEAIGVALEFQAKHPAETLIVVSADHDTGGLKCQPGEIDTRYIGMSTATMGIDCRKDPEDVVYNKAKAAGLELTEEERKALPLACKVQDVKQRGYAVMAVVHGAVNKRIGISWATHGHTSEEVPLFAGGPCSEMFAGKMENSDVGNKLKSFFTPAK